MKFKNMTYADFMQEIVRIKEILRRKEKEPSKEKKQAIQDWVEIGLYLKNLSENVDDDSATKVE